MTWNKIWTKNQEMSFNKFCQNQEKVVLHLLHKEKEFLNF